jgi:hypothetical protein
MKKNTRAENSVKTEDAGRGRLLRTALLAYTLAGPAIRAWIKKRANQGSQAVATVAQAIPEAAQSRQADFRERLEELTRESRQRAVEQAQNLRAQASQLQAQSRQLRKAVREEAKQRRKLLAQMRDSGLEWGQDMLKRGEHLTGDLVERGEEITHDLAKRGEEITHDLAKRGRKARRTLAKRSEELLVPSYEQNRVLWMVAGFGVGLAVAGAVTYRLVRGRAMRQAQEEDQAIELPQTDSWNGKVAHPAGEILHFDLNGATIATLEAVSVANAERPENAAFVGVISTQSYYPVDAELEFTDLVYFFSEEEARTRGFKAAE